MKVLEGNKIFFKTFVSKVRKVNIEPKSKADRYPRGLGFIKQQPQAECLMRNRARCLFASEIVRSANRSGLQA